MAVSSEKMVTIQVVRRTLETPEPGESVAKHDYLPVLTTRATVKGAGTKVWGQIEIDGKRVTHTFEIRWTPTVIDTRDRVRDALGGLYQILSVDHQSLGRRVTRLMCCLAGAETIPSVR